LIGPLSELRLFCTFLVKMILISGMDINGIPLYFLLNLYNKSNAMPINDKAMNDATLSMNAPNIDLKLTVR
jgi:hypothetical protein